jgi:hypothetical protein
MNHTSLIFSVFSLLVGTLVLAIWSNSYVYAQRLPSSPTVSNSLSKPISQEIKTKMCDPSNPGLKVVNTTEARICGIPKTVKPPSLQAATPSTSAVSSSPSPSPQQTVTKPTPVASGAAAPPKQQQQIATTNYNNKTVSSSTSGATGITMAPVSNSSNRSLSLSLPSAIAPQVKAVNQQQQQPVIAINSTAGQNYTFAATSPVVASDKLLYLGYHGTASPTHTSSGSKDKSSSSSDSKPSADHSKSSTTTDNGSKEKKKTSISKLDRTPTSDSGSSSKDKSNSDVKSSSYIDDVSTSSSSSDLASAITNKVHSMIKNSLLGHDVFGFSDSGGF